MWVRGLKQSNARYYLPHLSSHPMWVRGLKQQYPQVSLGNPKSHPMWVRGLKHNVITFDEVNSCRTLCGCVD